MERYYEEGQPVWLYDPSHKKGVCPALTCPWMGPFVVVGWIAALLYKIQKGPKAVPRVVHSNRLKPYMGRNPPAWFK